MREKNNSNETDKIPFMKSMKKKLALTFLLTSATILAIVIILAGTLSDTIITNENNNKFIYLSGKNANEIDGWLSVQGQIVNDIVDSITNQKNIDKDQLLQYLTMKTKSNQYTSDIYFGFADKSFLDGSGWTPGKDYDCTSRTWYKRAQEKGDLVYGTPTFDMTTEQMVMVISKPVIMDGELLGVIGMDVSLETLNNIVQQSIDAENSYAFLLDEQDNVLIHFNKDFMPKDDKVSNLKDILNITGADLKKRMDEKKKLTILKDYDSNSRYFALTTIKATGWGFGIAISDKVYSKPVSLLVSYLVFFSIAAILYIIVLSYFVGNSIAKPIIALSRAIKKQARLDFSSDDKADFLKYRKRTDEIGVITNSLMTMEDNVRQLLVNTTDTVSNVAATAEELNAASKQSAVAAQEVAQTIYEIAKGASEQAVNTEKSTRNLIELGDLIDKDKTNIDKLADEYGNVEKLVDRGLSVVNELANKAKANSEAASIVYQSILKTNQSSEKISEASNFISSVADQTNLLSLNAAIEAARAGEQGKGFAVVASEIRKLAEQSTRSTVIINEIVQALREDASTAVSKMEEAEIIVKEQLESVRQTETNYKDILTAMNNAKEAVQVLDDSSNHMQDRKDDLLDSIQNLSAIAEENAASTEEASASMEETSASTEEIATSSESLSKTATELQLLISKFKV